MNFHSRPWAVRAFPKRHYKYYPVETVRSHRCHQIALDRLQKFRLDPAHYHSRTHFAEIFALKFPTSKSSQETMPDPQVWYRILLEKPG